MLGVDERRALARAYANRSLELLEQSLDDGLCDAETCRQEEDLDPLKSLQEFKDLVGSRATNRAP